MLCPLAQDMGTPPAGQGQPHRGQLQCPGQPSGVGPHRRMRSVPRIRVFASPPAGRALCASFPGCESLVCFSSDVFITAARSPQAPGLEGVQKWPAHPW